MSDLTELPSVVEWGRFYEADDCVASSITEYSITFTKTFPSTPRIALSIECANGDVNIAQAEVMVRNNSATGFTLRFVNPSTSTYSFAVQWIAMA